MLSLPLLPPQPDILPGRLNLRPRSPSPPPNARNNQQGHRQHLQPHSRRDDDRKSTHHRPNPLALLTADEAAISARKNAIRYFGSYWIRPPGIPKTLQAMNEEMAELAEQEELMRQEQNMRDLQAQQQAEEARANADAGEEEEEGEERDLDDEIPDADGEGEVESEEDEDEDGSEEGVEGDGEVTFNEESMVEGSRVMDDQQLHRRDALREEAELTGAARDEEDLGVEMERDLDDSVPEAGSYQHTDTEVEDSTTDDAADDDDDSPLRDSFAASARRPRQPQQAQRQPPPAPSSSARRQNLRSSTRSQAQQPQRGLLPFEATDNSMTPANGSMQDRFRAAAGADASIARSPGSLNLSSSIIESSFVSSSPVMQRGGRGRGRRGG